MEALYGLCGLLLHQMELNPFWEMNTSPNHVSCSHPFLACISIFPLIGVVNVGGNGERFSLELGFWSFLELIAACCSVCFCQQHSV